MGGGTLETLTHIYNVNYIIITPQTHHQTWVSDNILYMPILSQAGGDTSGRINCSLWTVSVCGAPLPGCGSVAL